MKKCFFLFLFLAGAGVAAAQKNTAGINILHTPVRNEMIIYPNPSDGQNIHISLKGFWEDELLVVVYDILGREMFSKILVYESGGYLFSLDTSNTLSPGVYMIVASANNDVYMQRLVVR